MINKKLLYNKRLDDAARAGWLYYIAKNTQDEVAQKMGISRQAAQRLVTLAVENNLISFRLNHPMEDCLNLAEQIKEKYHITYCEVTLNDMDSDDPALGIAEVACREIEKYLKYKTPITIGIGTGKEIKGAIDRLPPIYSPQHCIVSLVGSMTPSGATNVNHPIMRIGDLTGAPRHSLSMPVFASSKQERDILVAQIPIQKNYQLALSADVAFIGIGELNDNPPLLEDGFLMPDELKILQQAGGIGEILGRVFDCNGQFLEGLTNDRVSSVKFPNPLPMPVIGVARGSAKLEAIRASLKGSLVSGLITDEATAAALLKD